MGFDVSTSSAPGPAPAVPSARPPHRRRARGGRPKRTTRLASPPAPSSRSIHRETNHRRPPLSTWNTSADSPGSGLVLGQGGRGASRRDRRRAPSRRVRARVSLSRPPTADRRPPTADRRPPTADRHGDRRPPTDTATVLYDRPTAVLGEPDAVSHRNDLRDTTSAIQRAESCQSQRSCVRMSVVRCTLVDGRNPGRESSLRGPSRRSRRRAPPVRSARG
jgi:hypothetical protein